jgi:hypothetical protein
MGIGSHAWTEKHPGIPYEIPVGSKSGLSTKWCSDVTNTSVNGLRASESVGAKQLSTDSAARMQST